MSSRRAKPGARTPIGPNTRTLLEQYGCGPIQFTLHVRGYKEEGTTTTPFDMCVLNDLDRFHLVGDVIDRVLRLGTRAAYAKQAIRDKLMEHKQYITRHGDDMPEITGWRWGHEAALGSTSSTEGDNV